MSSFATIPTRVTISHTSQETPQSPPVFLTTKAATSCPPPVLADLWRQLARVASRRAPHALLMVVHEVVGAQHAPARARLRLAAVLVARPTSFWNARTKDRSGRATLRPPSSS